MNGPGTDRYSAISMRPLHILVFLLPIIAAYEAGSWMYLTDASGGVAETIRAHSILLGFFRDAGIIGRFLPSAALVTVLLVWHLLNRDPFRISGTALGGMLVESVAWTLPLLVIGVLIQGMGAPAHPAAGGPEVPTLMSMPWQARLTISLGAGLYEEFLFRMIAIAAVHFVLVDLARAPELWGRVLAVSATAIAFALYHPIRSASGGWDVASLAFYLFAGSYFGVVYLLRGFAIVVAVHALFDVMVLLRPFG